MTTPIILTVINIVLAWFFFYRIGKQSVINDLIKAFKEECQNSEAGMEIIYALKERIRQLEEKLANTCDGKEGTDD